MRLVLSWHFTFVVLSVIVGLFILLGVVVGFTALITKIKVKKARKVKTIEAPKV